MSKKHFSAICLVIFISVNARAGLIARYEFNGNANDILNRYNGSLHGDAHIVTDPIRGQVLAVDGEGDYTGCGSSFRLASFGGLLTIMAWAKSNTTDYGNDDTGGGRILSFFRDFGTTSFSIYASGNSAHWMGFCSINASPDNFSVDSLIPVAVDNWNNIALVKNDHLLQLYINGTLTGTVSNEYCSVSFNQAIIGAYLGANGAENCFNGLIDDVRIYDRALTETQIKDAMYNSEVPEPSMILLLGLGTFIFRIRLAHQHST